VTGPGPILDAAAFDAVVAELVAGDEALARIVAEHGVPPFWSRPAGFRALVLLILEQQVSLASAEAAYRRLRARVRTVTPETILACSPEELRADGVSRQKDRYLRALAEAVDAGALDLDALATRDDATARAELIALPGIGRWTADVYLLACLGRPDLWPVGDRALQVAVAEALDRAEVPDPVALEKLGERWRPHRSSAARVLWHGYLGRRGRVETPHDLLDDLPG
jgi:DNA-3-methyladenine glycosylase II